MLTRIAGRWASPLLAMALVMFVMSPLAEPVRAGQLALLRMNALHSLSLVASQYGEAVRIVHWFSAEQYASGGSNPYTIIQGSDGYLYGVGGGGTGNAGTVFKMTPSGALTVLHSFCDGTVKNDGSSPCCLVEAPDHNCFYGMTETGGLKDKGAIFKMTPSGKVSILHSFEDGDVAHDGACSWHDQITVDKDGNVYGTTQNGGSTVSSGASGMMGFGTIFKMTPKGVVTILHSFGDKSVRNDGSTPTGGLIQASDGNLYGTTMYGGANGSGTAYKITPSGRVTILHSFGDDEQGDGTLPISGLVQGPDGNLYGTTNSNVFKMTPLGVVTILHSFTGGTIGEPGLPYQFLDGSNAAYRPIVTRNGDIYGTTAQYPFRPTDFATTGLGVVFRITPSGDYCVVHFFGGSALHDGATPCSDLIQGADGNLYGVTGAGGDGVDPNGPRVYDPSIDRYVVNSDGIGGGTVFKVVPGAGPDVLQLTPDELSVLAYRRQLDQDTQQAMQRAQTTWQSVPNTNPRYGTRTPRTPGAVRAQPPQP